VEHQPAAPIFLALQESAPGHVMRSSPALYPAVEILHILGVFCSRSAWDSCCSAPMRRMLAGTHVYICDACIGLCIAYLPLRSKLNAFATMFSPWKCIFEA